MNKYIFNYCVAITAASLLWFASCKKETGYTITKTTDDSETQAIIADDELFVNSQFDQAINDAIKATSISSTTSGDTPPPPVGNALFTTIPGAVIDTAKIDSGIVKITYYGANADHTIGRSGEVIIQHGLDGSGKVIPWKTLGAHAGLSFNQYEVVVLATNKSLWFNGSGAVNNVTGELIQNIANSVLVPGDTLVDKIRAQIDFTFNDNVAIIQTWHWNFSYRRLFEIHDTTITASLRGDSVINGSGNVSTWGTTRFGQEFNSNISATVSENIYGSSFIYKPLTGIKTIVGIPEQLTITYGVTAQGTPQSSGNPYGYKITWFRAGSQQKIISY
jgi:hypothetical protein